MSAELAGDVASQTQLDAFDLVGTRVQRAIERVVVAGVGFKPFYVGPIRYARNLEAIAELWIHMAIPPLGARTTSRKFWFSISGDP